MPLITKLILSLSLLIANTNVSHAKRDFYVPKEITCTKELCYLKKTKSPFTGELKEFDYNGKLYSSTEYKNGKKHGAQKYYYPDGNISSLELFVNGTINGHARSFYNNGKIKEEMYFEDGIKKDSHRKFFETGTLSEETEYSNNKKNGRQHIFYENGKLQKETIFDNDISITTTCFTHKGYKTTCK
jgi:antitoxin component YwqK of YwqJK toxin-antitoxin module